MATRVFANNLKIVSEVSGATVTGLHPALLAPKGDPGVSTYKGSANKLALAVETVLDQRRPVGNQASAMTWVSHSPEIIIGPISNTRMGWGTFINGSKNVFHGMYAAVRHVELMMVNSLQRFIDNVSKIAANLGEGFAQISKQDLEELAAQIGEEALADLLAMLKDPATYGSLALDVGTVVVSGALDVTGVGAPAGVALAAWRFGDRAVAVMDQAKVLAGDMQRVMGAAQTASTPAQQKALALDFLKSAGSRAPALLMALIAKVKAGRKLSREKTPPAPKADAPSVANVPGSAPASQKPKCDC
ncbi:hypothetical protein [Parachitinimonas caeni]|uniref:Uncharacterized protein n=1 Tax=Parachitinimonas caeni TaxID=3031301 RepID=A0ABT7DZZ1_9NEIS|nr:hypothetical protein [Parachitinimonas caeni]MDK2125626.1 hypothetical protein [Parachitinimonas caeni]